MTKLFSWKYLRSDSSAEYPYMHWYQIKTSWFSIYLPRTYPNFIKNLPIK